MYKRVESFEHLSSILDDRLINCVKEISIKNEYFDVNTILTVELLRTTLDSFDDLDYVELCIKIETEYELIITDDIAEKLFNDNFKTLVCGIHIKYDRDNKLNELGIDEY